MVFELDAKLEANPDVARSGDSVQLTFTLHSTRDTTAKITYSIAPHWNVAFDQGGRPTKSLEFNGRPVHTSPTTITRTVRLIRTAGGTTPAALAITATAENQASGASLRTADTITWT